MTPRTHHKNPFLSFAALLAAVLFSILVFAAPAAAHDELSLSSPTEGATVQTLPEAIELTFTNAPAAIGSEVIITDPSGTDWADGAVSITNNVATQPTRPGAPAGTYQVQWRVVSSDSHAIEGSFAFTVNEGQEAAAPKPGSEPAEASTTTESSQGANVPLLILAGIAMTAVLAGLVLFVRRRLTN
ncbi:methionine-rich copper-binding protein CopC [Arthrobacter sp. CAN_A214]|uniref:copper resistance CopC family protein n=1 Tax=Arthrobacter sp. CAN_A214 TaxID=2787720 RepID=UPI0018C8FD19